MVIYDLVCEKNHRFEGWFPSFEGYQEQFSQGEVACPVCGTHEVEKLPNACAVHLKRETEPPRPQVKNQHPPLTEAEAKEMLLRLHHYVRENSQDVGPRFAEEARAIFYGRSEEKSIYGTSTPEEREGLDEDGIPYITLPKPDLDS